MSQRKIEMHWVCTSCQTRNLGRHKTCQHCGDPKDASEKWIMPTDTAAAASVTDPALLRQASAGADWQCSFCKSHQKRLDGACANCGAAQSEGAQVPKGGAYAQQTPAWQPQRVVAAPPPRKPISKWWIAAPFAALAGLIGCCGIAMALAPDPPPPELHKPVLFRAEVADVRWTHVVHVDRYRIVGEEGFDAPGDAMDVVSHGERHHHDEQVLDHYETEHYTEQVPYQDTETYQDREECGQDCTDNPEHCSETCEPDENGFATCTTHCTGGGQTCSPRYCNVTRTRQVTRYRSEPRTRQVPRYRTEPRFAEHFGWRAWRWGHDRDVTATGDESEAPHAPTDAELAPPSPLGEGERERFGHDESYRLELTYEEGGHMVRVPEPVPTRAEYDRVLTSRQWYVNDAHHLVKPVFAP